MDNVDRFYFTKDDLANTPSRKCGISEARELSFRQQAANFIQDMGQRLQVNQLCINTAIVYMHRFYVFHSFTEIHRNKLSLSALFLAAKVEEQPRKLEHLLKVAHACLHKDLPPLDVRSEAYQERVFEVVAHENILLQTLGFVLAIEHPHTYVVKVCQLVKASKDLAQTSYIMATTSLHMTTMCLMYKPTLVACVCIHLACKWSDWRIEPCSEGRDWFYYVDRSVKLEKLEALTDRFIAIMETSPHRFKKKFGQKDGNYHGPIPRSLMEEPSTSKAGTSAEKYSEKQDLSSPGPSSLSYDFADFDEKPVFKEKSPAKSIPQPLTVQPSVKPSTPAVQPPSTVASTPLAKKTVKAETPHSISLDVYREKKEKERLHNKVSAPPSIPPPTESSIMHPQITKKPQLAFHETEKVSHRTSVKYADILSVSNKERVKVKEDPLDPSTSVNKLNHQIVKSNSDGSHHKERSNYSHNSKITHQAIDPVIKPEKIDVVIKPEKGETKQERIDLIKPEKLDIVKVGKVEQIKSEKVNLIKQEKIDSFRPEKVEVEVESKISSLPVAPTPALIHRPCHKEENVVMEGKKEKKERHRKHSSHSSKEKSTSNHLTGAPPSGIKVKIPKTIINLSGIIPESSQKYPPLPVKPESPKRSIKIKLPKPPENSKAVKPAPSTPIKLVITKDKSGTGSYSTSHKNERDRASRKRMHSNSIDGNGNTVCDVPASKYQKVDHIPKSHHSSALGGSKPSKSSRHSSHRSGMEHSMIDGDYVMQHPSNGNNACSTVNAQSYSQGFMYNLTPPPPPPKLKGYGVPVGKTNSIPPLPPPLPPPQSPPPPPPPE